MGASTSINEHQLQRHLSGNVGTQTGSRDCRKDMCGSAKARKQKCVPNTRARPYHSIRIRTTLPVHFSHINRVLLDIHYGGGDIVFADCEQELTTLFILQNRVLIIV